MSKKISNRSLVTEPNQHSIVATSIFNAPRELVFKLMTDPELIPQWWGPRVLTTTVDKMEPWSGGSWRYVVSDQKGSEWTFHGVYHTIEAPLRIIYTYEDEGLPGKVSLETTMYEDHDGGTKVTTISVFQSIEDRDAMMQSGMQEGGDETMDRLEELLAKMHAGS
ncbi:MAG: SRPBCC family protein [Chloroflexota bacterium]|nr:SRPBCC family protein [Chloroflexota bacterium]